MNPRIRRDILASRPNTGSRLDYVVTVNGRMTAGAPKSAGITVLVRYVPDRVVLERQAFSDYLKHMSDAPAEDVEALAVTILDDLNDELIARWLHVTVVKAETPDDTGGELRVTVEDRQPRWNNAQLLTRLERF